MARPHACLRGAIPLGLEMAFPHAVPPSAQISSSRRLRGGLGHNLKDVLHGDLQGEPVVTTGDPDAKARDQPA